MKIGILNMQFSPHNYGALLQAAALESCIRSIMPDACVEHIDARPAWLMASSRGVSRYMIALKRVVKAILGREPKIPSFGNYEVFSDFRQEYIQLTNNVYVDQSDFESKNWDYDLVVVGSDQVFRIKYMKNWAYVFFLSFLPDSCRRVAYAASFGVDHWEGHDDAEFTSKVGRALEQFDSISVREASGVDICMNTFGLDAAHVLDPTLLIGREYFDKIIEDAGVDVCASDWSVHCISNDAAFITDVPNLALEYKKSLKDIYFERVARWPLPSRSIFSSVPEWLAYIRDTKELVFTDSFHGVCFCILFEKDFLVFTSKDKGAGRMTSLLGMLGLEDRICSSEGALLGAIKGTSPIDYAIVREVLAHQRLHSLTFLRESILKI
tara:strand:- start:5075 stop:6217 length:1143 start_codon:yes stop_codon:yes gene_type:complete